MNCSKLWSIPHHCALIVIAACFELTPQAFTQDKPAAPATSAPAAALTSPDHAATPAPFAYEIVSVKSAKPGCPGMSLNEPPGRFIARCVTVWGLLYNAYEVNFSDYPPGLRSWASSAAFDIDAKTDEATAAAMGKLPREEQDRQRRLMLQALLADRFKLRVHTETRVQSIYALVIAKGGAKLKPWPTDQKTKGRSWGRSQIRLEGWPMDNLASCLTDVLGREVVDKSGLAGNYDIDLKWTPDDQQGTPDAGPTLFTALREQLGLKLIPSKGPVDIFVIDHVEKPAEN